MALSFPQSRQAARYYNTKARLERIALTPDAGVSQAECETGAPIVFAMDGVVPAGGSIKWAVISEGGSTEAVITDDTALDTDITVTGAGTVRMRLISELTDGRIVRDETTLTVWDAPTADAGPDQAEDEGVEPIVFPMAAAATFGTGAWAVQGATGTADAEIVDDADAETNVVVTGHGTVTLRWTVTPEHGCAAVHDDVVLTVNEV